MEVLQPTHLAAASLTDRTADVVVITNAVRAGEFAMDDEVGAKLLTTLRGRAGRRCG